MIQDTIADGAMAVLRGWRNDGADGESAHLVCDYVEQLRVERDEALAQLNTPELHDFAKAVRLEGAHQRQRWGAEHDDGKAPADWFWLVGYLAGKALASHVRGEVDKALHHTITAAAALANWHSAILGKTDMRPWIARPAGDDLLAEAAARAGGADFTFSASSGGNAQRSMDGEPPTVISIEKVPE